MDHQNSLNLNESPEALAARLFPVFNDLLLLSRALTHRSYLNEHPEALEDNERLEFLGDAVLDFLVGAWLYENFPEMPEGDLTRMRSALVHTAQLAEFAREINLGSALRLGRGESQAGGKNRSALLCDTFEAIIGALFLDQDIQSVKDFLNPFLIRAAEDIILNHKDEDPKSKLQEWAQGKGYPAPTYITRSTSGPDHSKEFEVEVFINNTVHGSGSGPSKHVATKQAAIMALNNLNLNG